MPNRLGYSKVGDKAMFYWEKGLLAWQEMVCAMCPAGYSLKHGNLMNWQYPFAKPHSTRVFF